jgi:hypothetical protein
MWYSKLLVSRDFVFAVLFARDRFMTPFTLHDSDSLTHVTEIESGRML